MKYELIIFDCDGTLVDSEMLTCQVIAEMLTEWGIPYTTQQSYDQFVGGSMAQICQVLFDRFGDAVNTDEFEKEYRQRCFQMYKERLEPIEGALKILKNLKIRSCIASNGPQSKMDVTLAAAGIDHFFVKGQIFSAYDIQSWKPQPDLFLMAAKKMGVAPENCLVIEDTITGVKAGIAAQMKVIAYNPKAKTDMIDSGVPNFTSMLEIYDFLAVQGLI